MTFLILGGYGNTGRALAQLLLQETNIHLILAGRDKVKADRLAADFNSKYNGSRVSGIYADASDFDCLRKALSGIDLVIVASSTSEHIETVARATLENHTDYIDPQFAINKTRYLQSITQQITETGCCFITDAGFHPGLPAAMVRYAALEYDKLKVANVSSVIKINWKNLSLSHATTKEFIREFMSFKPILYSNKQWKNLGLSSMLKPAWFEFEKPFGRQYAIAMDLPEMHPLPDLYPDLIETGFFVGGFNWFVDWIASPLALIALKIAPQKGLSLATKLMDWGLKSFSKPPYGTVLKLKSSGIKNNRNLDIEITISHADGYALTAIPMAACLLQYIDGEINKPGLWYQALAVEPKRFITDIERLGALVKVQHKDQHKNYPEKGGFQ